MCAYIVMDGGLGDLIGKHDRRCNTSKCGPLPTPSPMKQLIRAMNSKLATIRDKDEDNSLGG